MTAPYDLATLHDGCSGDSRHVEVLGDISVFLRCWVRDFVVLDELGHLLFGGAAADFGQTDHLNLAFVRVPSLLKLGHFTTAVGAPDFPENEKCGCIRGKVDVAFACEPLLRLQCLTKEG